MFSTEPVQRDDLKIGAHEAPDWLDEARAMVAPGDLVRIAYREEEAVHVLPLAPDCTRIGRSPLAEILLEDPTVSRRHALIAFEDDGLHVYDDRSLNGVFVNGERIEETVVTDGDEIVIGRFHMYVVAPLPA